MPLVPSEVGTGKSDLEALESAVAHETAGVSADAAAVENTLSTTILPK